ncbi:hypothetical protein ETB97_008543 [Aspergillus alliaceus]|uniref:Uncharacterized protein n=1 Tax=Petromyces alliaceus TaxID=209559 RepID=A0A8H6E964_PETAA|nr:hypothetical protein ETB97_008543 [Aspergillus burnettii]
MQSASIHCGTKAVQWEEFADAVSILVAAQDKIRKLFDFETWKEGPQTLGEVQTFGANALLEATSRLFLRTENGETLQPVKGFEYLVTLKTFDAGDPRDLIYSLLSIASDTQNYSAYSGKSEQGQQATSTKIVFDYELPDIEVYGSFMWYCIDSSGSLDIICRPWAMPLKNTRRPLPSWIRLLRDAEFGKPEEAYDGQKNREILVGPVGHLRYNVSSRKLFERVTLRNEYQGGSQRNGLPPEVQREAVRSHLCDTQKFTI